MAALPEPSAAAQEVGVIPVVQNGFNEDFVTEEPPSAPQRKSSADGKVDQHINGHYQNGIINGSHSAQAPRFKLQDTFIDEPRRLRVAVIGAGLAGITAGILLPAKVPNIDLTIFEKNHDVSGKHAPPP